MKLCFESGHLYVKLVGESFCGFAIESGALRLGPKKPLPK
jgi:hypothetical protein